ncbi:MAG: hypothetical protein QOI58_3021 [Thermoanaerobaculia bacterium]|nr:hypothetical protein [Thermoanaerobaculia bacterium]
MSQRKSPSVVVWNTTPNVSGAEVIACSNQPQRPRRSRPWKRMMFSSCPCSVPLDVRMTSRLLRQGWSSQTLAAMKVSPGTTLPFTPKGTANSTASPRYFQRRATTLLGGQSRVSISLKDIPAAMMLPSARNSSKFDICVIAAQMARVSACLQVSSFVRPKILLGWLRRAHGHSHDQPLHDSVFAVQSFPLPP